MNMKRFTLAAAVCTFSGVFLTACSGTNSASLAPTSTPEAQTQSEVPIASNLPVASPQLLAAPTPSASPVSNEDAGPKMSEKDDANSLQKDLDNTQIQTESFN